VKWPTKNSRGQILTGINEVLVIRLLPCAQMNFVNIDAAFNYRASERIDASALLSLRNCSIVMCLLWSTKLFQLRLETMRYM